MPLTLKLRRSNYVNERYTFDREQTARVLDEEAELGCWYRMSKFSLSAAVARISTEKHSRVCVSGCKLVSESHCEAPGIYNYRAGVLFQQDCEVNKPAGEERRRERKRERREKDRREEARGNEEKSSARTFSRYSACYKVDGTLEGKGERRRADRDGKDERRVEGGEREEEGRGRGAGATRAGNKLWARGVWRTCCARPRYALAGEWMREERGFKFRLNVKQALPSRAISPEIATEIPRRNFRARATNTPFGDRYAIAYIVRFIFIVIL